MSESDTVDRAKPEVTGKQAAKSGTHGHERVAAWPPRAMRAEQGAVYLSISRSLFLKLVEEEVLPKPTKVPGHDVSTWDRLDLDAAYEDWKTNREPSENTVHRRLRELDEQRRKNGPV
jgi:predicted DNA-binding transcriptional regulator AlpA